MKNNLNSYSLEAFVFVFVVLRAASIESFFEFYLKIFFDHPHNIELYELTHSSKLPNGEFNPSVISLINIHKYKRIVLTNVRVSP